MTKLTDKHFLFFWEILYCQIDGITECPPTINMLACLYVLQLIALLNCRSFVYAITHNGYAYCDRKWLVL